MMAHSLALEFVFSQHSIVSLYVLHDFRHTQLKLSIISSRLFLVCLHYSKLYICSNLSRWRRTKVRPDRHWATNGNSRTDTDSGSRERHDVTANWQLICPTDAEINVECVLLCGAMYAKGVDRGWGGGGHQKVEHQVVAIGCETCNWNRTGQ